MQSKSSLGRFETWVVVDGHFAFYRLARGYGDIGGCGGEAGSFIHSLDGTVDWLVSYGPKCGG